MLCIRRADTGVVVFSAVVAVTGVVVAIVVVGNVGEVAGCCGGGRSCRRAPAAVAAVRLGF